MLVTLKGKTLALWFTLISWGLWKMRTCAEICDEQFMSTVFCRCEEMSFSENTLTCLILDDVKKTDDVWSSISKTDNVVALTIQSRLPFKLGYLPVDALRRMPNLVTLTLQEFDLGVLEPYSLANWKHLKNLKLERNEITRLERHAIANLPKLKNLALSENFLTELLAESLAGLDLLEHLFLDRNNISRIEACAFCDLQNLKELELWGNQLTDLTEYTFRGLRYLIRLDLYLNQIRLLNDKVFHSMPKLIELDLRNNYIDHISPRAFHGLEHLQRLMLIGNKIKVLPDQVFASLPKLMAIDLNDNVLETFQVEILDHAENAKHPHFSLMFSSNPLKCDCRLDWVRSFLKLNKSHQFTRELMDLKCHRNNGQAETVWKLKMKCPKIARTKITTTTSTTTHRPTVSTTDKTPLQLQSDKSAFDAEDMEDDEDTYLSDSDTGSEILRNDYLLLFNIVCLLLWMTLHLRMMT